MKFLNSITGFAILLRLFCPFCGIEQKENEKQEDNATKQDNNGDQVMASDTSKREPGIILGNTILDIEEPEIIVEEIGKDEPEEQ